MTRLLTVWYPDWPVVAAGAAGEAAIVVHANRVVARSPAAARAGVQSGQRRRAAQQACPDAALIDHDPDRDARAFEPVLAALGAFAPRIEQVRPGWATVPSRGPARYFGGDDALVRQVRDAVVAAVPAAVGVGLADGRFAAAIAAHLASGDPAGIRVVAPGASPAFLAPRPVAWLHHLDEVDAELVGLLARMGLGRLGALAALAEGTVLARFGPVGRRAHRLAAGLDDRPAGGAEPVVALRLDRVFDDPVDGVGPIVFVAKQLADELTSRLAAEGRVCTRLIVGAETEHGERTERVWYRAAGLAAAAMVDRVRWQLDGWLATPGAISAGVVIVWLVADEVRADDGDQPGLWGGRSARDERAARAIARLAGMAGEEAVLVPAWNGGRLPDDRYTWLPAVTTDLADPDDTAERVRPRLEHPWPGALPAPAPSTVLPAAREAVLADATGELVRVTGRGELSADPATLTVGDGRPVAVQAWAGPWPIEERWWDPTRHRRLARVQVVTADGHARLLVVERQRWWVAAAYR